MTDVTTLPTNKPPLMVLRERLEQRKIEIKNALPSDVSVDAFIRAAITSAQLNPEILACSWQSLWTACLRACRDGLLPDGVEGAIVPYKSTATWIPMYPGLLRRFRRSGQFKWVTAGVVRDGETFEHWITQDGEHFRHIPGESVTAPIKQIYALATTKDGGVFVAVLPLAEANKIRNMSRATREDAPWKQWPEEMYKKTAIRRLAKLLPSARDIIGEDDIPEVPLAVVASNEPAPLPVDPPMTTPTGDVPEGGGQGEGSYPETPAADPAVPKGFKPSKTEDDRSK
jgi:recombination protein RecT